MNEIVIYPNETRQITGVLAHELAERPNWQAIQEQVAKDRFCVFEGHVLKASQSTVRQAYSYMNPDRVLVYWH